MLPINSYSLILSELLNLPKLTKILSYSGFGLHWLLIANGW